MDNAKGAFPTLNYAQSSIGACTNADAILVLTDWPEFIDLDPTDVGPVVKHKRIVGTRNCLDARKWQGAGWNYYGVGRPSQQIRRLEVFKALRLNMSQSRCD
jgi:UDPglucose 6-dehydrogenase